MLPRPRPPPPPLSSPPSPLPPPQVRGPLIPGMMAVKAAAKAAGAYGCTISGAGPTAVAICDNPDVAQKVGVGQTVKCRGYPPTPWEAPAQATGSRTASRVCIRITPSLSLGNPPAGAGG